MFSSKALQLQEVVHGAAHEEAHEKSVALQHGLGWTEAVHMRWGAVMSENTKSAYRSELTLNDEPYRGREEVV